jgi:RNA polymerase sigma-70 factor (sigma-E family)
MAAAVDGRTAEGAAALAELFRRHHVALVHLAVLMVNDQATAEDVVQDAFADVYRKAGTITDHDRALPYIRTAVVNRCRTVLRRRRLTWRVAATYDPPASSAESAVLLAEEHRAVLSALDRLPPRQREALVLRYYLGLDEAGTAEVMGVGRGTVKSTTSRALAALGRALGDRS